VLDISEESKSSSEGERNEAEEEYVFERKVKREE
jgi:hypothetical protein